MELPDKRVMTFCSAEVRAMSLLPRPYVADFPLTKHFFIPAYAFVSVLNPLEWSGVKLTTSLQQKSGVQVFSFFPEDDLMRRLVGENICQWVEIAKIRLFSSESRTGFRVRIVPMVTLSPLKKQGLETLLRTLLDCCFENASEVATRLFGAVANELAGQRLCQYILSCALGTVFMDQLSISVDGGVDWVFDLNEANYH